MDFLQRFNDRERERLLSVAHVVRLARGESLLRRGDPGGDLYRVEDGVLEVFDSRSQPVIVHQVITKGAMVGEMAFLDESPRSADVRASEGATCQRWERRSLIKLLHEEPELGARFYEMVARTLSERVRDLGVISSNGGRTGGEVRGSAQAAALGRTLGDTLRTRFMSVEPLLRRDKVLARTEALTALHNFQLGLAEAESRLSDVDRQEFGNAAAREMHPYLVRSKLGGLALDRASGHSGDPATLAHVMANKPEGDGPLGEFIDEWLLGLPTSKALQERRTHAAQSVVESLPADAAVRLLLLNAGGSPLLQDLRPYISKLRGEIICVDSSSEVLAAIDLEMAKLPRDLRLKLVQEDLGAVCLGHAKSRFPPQDIFVIEGLLDYLPERLGVSLLGWTAGQLAPAGRLVATGLGEAAADPVYRHLLGWPMVYRSSAAFAGLIKGAGYVDVRVMEAMSAALVATARAPVPGVG
ncbi:MAG: cyclic nucleotide-binding domain-containing protein [Myxococcales bacterium]|nr:cyclic nucleotide-binding domain-containing protein [Myxococcales bacterium]